MRPRKQAVLGPGIDGPVMEPRYDRSRVITLSDYMATERGVTIFWQAGTGHATHRATREKARSFAGKGKAGKHKGPGEKAIAFGDILEFHQKGLVPHAPVRDVRLSQASIQQIKLEVGKRWKLRVAGREAEQFPPTLPVHEPAPELPVPWTPAKIVATGQTDLDKFTFGIGGGKDLAERAISAGYATGFRRLPRKDGGPSAGVSLPVHPPVAPRPAPAIVPAHVPLPTAASAPSYALGSPAVPAKHVALPTFDVLPVQLPTRPPGGFGPPRKPARPQPGPIPFAPPRAARKAPAKVEAPPTKPMPTTYTQNAGNAAHVRAKLESYHEGDRKVEAIRSIGEEYAKRADVLDASRARRDATIASIRDDMSDQERRQASHALSAAEIEVNNAHAHLKQIEGRTRAQVMNLLRVESGLKFDHGGTADVLPDKARGAAEGAMNFLSAITARGNLESATFGFKKLTKKHQGREFYQAGAIHADENTSTKTMVHELGHMLEEMVPGWNARAQAFLGHRAGDEHLTQLASLPGKDYYEPDEYGRKDQFEDAFGDKAYYVGKDYGAYASEITAMGLEMLFVDPVGFARKDPEFMKLIIGLLSGELR